MNKEICVATNNKGKLKEYREILAPMGYVIYSPADLNIDCDPTEDGASYRENAFIKAKAFAKLVKFPVLADDSGLEIHALGAFPGIHSSRFAEECGGYPNAYEEIQKRLGDNPDRSAHFNCTICYLENVSAKPLYFEGQCPGTILKQRHGDHGFGYDPIFHCAEADLDFGIASEEEKNRFSHRAKAIAKLRLFLAIR